MHRNHDESPKGRPQKNGQGPQPKGNGKQAPSKSAKPDQRNIRDYLLMIRERWFYGLAMAIVLVGLLAFYQIRQPELFESHAGLVFEPNQERVVEYESPTDTSFRGGSTEVRMQTHLGQIRSNSFLEFWLADLTDEETEKIIAPYRTANNPEPRVGSIVYNSFDVNWNRNTYILALTTTHRDPEVAAFIANRIANKYIAFAKDRALHGNEAAVEFLSNQADQLRDRVEEAESALQDYRRTHNLVSIEENQNVVLRRLNGLSTSVVEARVNRIELETQLDYVDAYLSDEKDLMEINYLADYGSISELRTQLDSLKTERALLNQRYLENHPRMIENQRSIDSLQELIDQNVQMAVTELRSRHQRALRHEERLESELREAERDSLELEELSVRYRVLERQVESHRDAHAKIVDRLNETSIIAQLENINIRVNDQAYANYTPVEPNLQRIAIQGAFLGFLIFLGLPIGLGLLDNKLKSAWEVETLLGHSLLGEIPRLQGIKKKERAHIISQGSDNSACEAFRGIFSQLQLDSQLDIPHTLMLTSTLPGEGKSVVTSNLAATFAVHGRNTLLVDCDFRRPSLHRLYERKNERGIMEWMRTGQDEPGPLHENEYLGLQPVGRNLTLLRAGGESRNPTEMFDTDAFRRLFQQAAEEYDAVLIDTPPVGIFPDALFLSKVADQIIYVCQFNRGNKPHIRKILEKVESTKAEISGVVLNGIPTGRVSAYYDYYGYGQVGNKEYASYYAQKR